MNPPLICLITPGHISSTPRLVKEAEALIQAGYRVHIVAGSHYLPAMPLDESILAHAEWGHTIVRFGHGGPVDFVRKVVRKVSRTLIAGCIPSLRLAARAVHAQYARLADAAASVPADLYIGHCLAALPAAAYAAKKRGVSLGFDVEDFHATETLEAMRSSADRRATHILCSRLLPLCRHLTAASPLIARQCELSYGVTPLTVLNVFPLKEAPANPVGPQTPTDLNPLRLYWFSQTIGPGRGIESVIAALGRMRRPAELHLRGQCAIAYRTDLLTLASESGVRHPPVFHDSAPPSEMARLAADAHIGLSVESSTPPNRDICLTNKIFTYILAGVPVALSPTSAHQAIARDLHDACMVLDFSGNPSAAAIALDKFASDPELIRACRDQAWHLGQNRFNWDMEKSAFLHSVTKAISRGQSLSRDQGSPAHVSLF